MGYAVTRFLTILCIFASSLFSNAATWYVDQDAYPTSDNTGGSWANAWTNLTTIDFRYGTSQTNSIAPGDTIEISGGTYGKTVGTLDGWFMPFGTTNNPVTVKCSRAVGHNDLVIITNCVKMCAFSVLDGSKSDAESNFNTTWKVENLDTNIGLFINAGPLGVTDNYGVQFLSEVGYQTTVKWVAINPPDQNDGSCIGSAALSTSLRGISISYCVLTNYRDFAVQINQNSTPAYGDWTIHHCNLQFANPLRNGDVNMAGGCDFHHNRWRWPLLDAGCNDILQPGNGAYTRIYNNIFEPGGNSMMQTESSGTGYHDFLIYGNIFMFASSNAPVATDQPSGVMFNTIQACPDCGDMPVTNVFIFNNTVVGISQSPPGGLPSFLNQDYNGGDLTEIFYPSNAGVRVFNNLIYSTNGTGGLGLYSTHQGWDYSTNDVQVDYNITARVDYRATNIYYQFPSATAFNTFSGYAHNSSTMPSLRNIGWHDFTPTNVAVDAGVNLSAYVAQLPGLDTDLNGNPRGANGAWDIGALEYVDNTLKVWLRFTNDFAATNITDSSGNGNVGVRMSTTNWPYATNGPNGLSGAYYSDPRAYYDAFEQGDYIALTNLTGIDYLTNGTVALWSFADANSYGSSVLIGNLGTVGTGAESNCWAIARSGSENWRFRIRYLGGMEGDDLTNAIYFPIQAAGQYYETNWTHYAVTWASDGVNILVVGYYNGAPLATNTIPVPWLRSDNSQEGTPWIGIGVNPHDGTPQMDRLTGGDEFPNNGWFGGRLADVRIYNRALSATELEVIYADTGGSTTTPTILSIQNTTIGTLFLR